MTQDRRTYILFTGGLLLIAFLLVTDLIFGSVHIPFSYIYDNLVGQQTPNKAWDIILIEYRVPKVITAILAGIGLPLTGLMMQTFFRNPLAGPFVLGISSGASLGVAIWVMAGTALSAFLPIALWSTWGMIFASMIGSSLVLLMVLFASARIADSVSLLIIGIMFGSLTGAIVSILQYFSSSEQIHSFLIWTFGSLAGVTWEQLQFLIPAVLIGIGMFIFHQKSFNALLLGENYARGIGVNVGKLRLWIIICTSLIAGSLTAFVGPIAFIGVAVPHLARGVFRTADHRILIPGSALMGSALMLACDIVSQLPGESTVLPINSVCAVVGAPVIIWVIIKNRSK